VSEFDVAIIGGGPTGSAAALTLLRYSKLRPVVYERSSYDVWRVGETLSPGVFPLLSYLDAQSVLTDRGQRRAYATSAAWGNADVVSRDFLFTGGGDAWHLDRAEFDASLARLIVERGGTVLTGTALAAENISPGWTIGTPASRRLMPAASTPPLSSSVPERQRGTLPASAGEDAGAPIHARFVIDATGRHAAFARAQGAHATLEDHLTGLVAIFEGGVDDRSATLVEAVEDGWWYSARLPANRMVVAFMTDADIIRASHLQMRDAWLAHLDNAHATRARVGDAQRQQGPIVCPAHSQILDPISGDGWIAAGEAAVSFDPLSSMGIGYAIASGVQAARIAASSLNGDTEHAQLFGADIRKHYEAYLARRKAYYALEQRWPDSPFWMRRH
jgi:flavin-dependent dehydrogenase